MKVTGRIIAISKDREYYKVGVSSDDSIWYTKTPEVDVVCASLEIGWKVAVEYEWDEKKKKGFMSVVDVLEKTTRDSREKEDVRRKSIEKQAMMKAACEASKGYENVYSTLDELGDAIVDLYNKLYGELQK